MKGGVVATSANTLGLIAGYNLYMLFSNANFEKGEEPSINAALLLKIFGIFAIVTTIFIAVAIPES